MQEALKRAVSALRRKERSVSELDAWLAGRGVDSNERQATIDHLLSVGELDDERFARRFTEDKRELSGWGVERIRESLRARGIDADTVESALAEDGETEELARATASLRRRGTALGDDQARARALAYLARRGYAGEIAQSAIRRLDRAA